MAETRYEELKRAISAYGEAAFQNLIRSRALAEAIIAELPAYLGCDPKNVAAVPEEGPFDPRTDYGEKAFSFHNRRVIVLEPIRFGLSLIVGNVEDSGALWLRTGVGVEVIGEHFDVYVAERPVIRVPRDFEGKLAPAHEQIYQEFLGIFQVEVMEFNDEHFKNGIGFLPG